jgi:hypothetical protein
MKGFRLDLFRYGRRSSCVLDWDEESAILESLVEKIRWVVWLIDF